MQFKDLITNLGLISKYKKVNFVSSEYPLLFISELIKKIKKSNNVKVVQENIDNILPETYVSFLGQKTIFWLGNLTEKPEKEKNKVINFLKNYDGANTILTFYSEPILDSINLNFEIINNKSTFVTLAKFILGKVNKSLEFNIDQALKRYESLTLDQAILICYYGSVLGVSYKDFFAKWSDKIVSSEKSLFTLLALYFSSNKKEFLKYWCSVKDNYQPQFWTTYWSEVFYRAFWYVYCKKNNKLAEAKKISYRLPFSFINRDWKNFDLNKLAQMQDEFYNLDCSVKLGKSFIVEKFFL